MISSFFIRCLQDICQSLCISALGSIHPADFFSDFRIPTSAFSFLPYLHRIEKQLLKVLGTGRTGR